MAKRGRVEIIEVLPPDEARLTDLPGQRTSWDRVPSPPDPAHPERGSRRWWIVSAAVVGIAAVVVGAGALSDGASSGRGERPTDESRLDGATAVAPVVLPIVPATPAGYRIVGVEQTTNRQQPARPVRQLWATHADEALLSSWLEITASPAGLPTDAAGDSRVAVPGGIAVLDTMPDGDIAVTGPLAGGGAAAIVSSGVSRATLVELLGGLRFDGGALTSGDTRLGGMFQQVATDDGRPSSAGTDATMTVSYDAIVDDPRKLDDFTLTVGPLGSAYDETARRFFLGHRDTVMVNGQQALLGSDERDFGRQSITFERAGLRITVAGTAPRSVLLDAVQSAHVATGAELAGLLAAGPPPVAVTPAPTPATQVAAGQLSNGRRYEVHVSPGDDGRAQVTLAASGDDGASASVAQHDSYIATVVSPTMTALVAFIPATAVGAQLVLTLGDPSSPTTRSATPTALPDGSLVAALAFDEMQPFTAQIVLSDGRTLSVAAG